MTTIDQAPGAAAAEPRQAGGPIAVNCERIDVHVTKLRQLFNAIDPSPFREKDAASEAWRWDWPAVAPAGKPVSST